MRLVKAAPLIVQDAERRYHGEIFSFDQPLATSETAYL
jgi:hypothetical protein